MSLRNKILSKSRRMLLDEGYDKLSMRKIAREIDVTATSIYLHFRNKDHLVYTIIEESIEELNRIILSIAETNINPMKKIEKITRGYVAFGLERPQEYEVIFMLRPEEMPRYPRDKFRKARAGYEIIASVIEEGIEKKIIVEENPLTAAYTIWAQMHGVVSVILNRRLDNRIPENEFLNHAVKHILYGFLKNGTSQAST